MQTLDDVKKASEQIQTMKGLAQELKVMGEELPAMDRNLVRLLASIKMLELNFSDVFDLSEM